jgi:hypothetical protein|tara:strand:- start:103 stop:393 length:291 start_codon:yes stop_codon:yes gene_type:complete
MEEGNVSALRAIEKELKGFPLDRVPEDIKYIDWFRILSALKTTKCLGAKDVAKAWCSTGLKYDEDRFDKKWDAMDADYERPPTVGSVKYIKKQYGF